MAEVKRKIYELADSIAAEYGVQIADIELKGSLRNAIVRIFIDKDQGVTLEDCGKFSRAMSTILDVEDPIRTSYTLEVSSPGLDRALNGPEDFEKNIGKLVRIVTKESINNQKFFVGRLTDVTGDNLELSIDKKAVIYIPFNQIAKARLEIELK